MAEKIIGIDLGTTNSVVSIMEGNETVVIHNLEGERLTPSVVAFKEDGKVIVGSPAKRQAILNPENTIYSIKRFMGRRYDEAIDDIRRVPYRVVRGKNDRVEVYIPIENKTYTPEQISAEILRYIKRSAENYLGETITKAVITVPAYFNDAQRQATKDAGKIAGLEVVRVLPEPTASALAYGLNKTDQRLKVAVYDLGGGTFDISILELSGGVFEVIATHGDTHLGGDDIDNRIIEWLIEEFRKETGIDLSRDKQALQRLKEAAEKAKKELSFQNEAVISLPFIALKGDSPMHLEKTLTRARLEAMAMDLIKRSIELIKEALEEAKLRPQDINEVILVGGQTRMPLVQRMIQEFFNKEPHKGINPDEVVAIGAAIQAAIISGEYRTKDIVLLDVTPLSLGVEVLGGLFDVVIPKNTTIPTKKTKTYTTAEDNQTSVWIKVYQGERRIAKENRLLGEFELSGIPPAPRGVPQIEVTFDINVDGILTVSAIEKATNKKADIKIHARTGLTEEEIERMIREAQEKEEEDKIRAEVIELRNQLDAYIYSVEKSVKEISDKISEDEKRQLDEKISKAKEALKSENKEEIQKAYDELQSFWNSITTRIYQTYSKSNEGPNNNQDFREEK
ncbi:MAG: molecular chaperone DnaK [candidate division WOR-3 bacterium]|nr:molecular chaperone DnaK [candidate division WOR-3 bacterium]MDW8151153.1 molecular chaperone DnaK [candidate division WOR-3 bacterium]